MGPDRCFGLCQVHPDVEDHEATAEKKVDIIFMHGLDAQSPKTWIAWLREDDEYSGDVNWLSDKHMLPSALPYARILTYDWNANYDTTASSDRFLGHADTLLDRVYVNREELCRLQIPIIFVASCFSGLLLAQALVRATDRYHPRGAKYRQILDFTVGVAFLGTPFLGSWDTGYTVAELRVAVAIQSDSEYNRELMEYLRRGTRESPGPLDDLVQKFSEMIHNENFKFGKVCFYETRHTNFSAYRKKLPKDYAARLDSDGHGIVVSRNSACLQGVEGVALDVRHNLLHKFNSPQNDGYQRLVSRLKGFLERAPDVLSVNGYSDAYFGADIRRKDNEERERRNRCLESLYFDGIDYEPSKIREPGETACQWLLKDQLYSDWHNNGRGILWILGNPGSGKSTLIKHAIRSSPENATGASAHILSFFFHNQGEPLQHSTEGLLRALLYQLLENFPEQTNTLTEKFAVRKPKNANGSRWKTAYLMRHLESCLEKVVERFDLRIFVDALDECRMEEEEGDDETEEIRDLIRNLQDIEQRLSSSPNKLSLCFACRHYPNLARPGVDTHIIAEQGNRADIEEFVHREISREINIDKDKDLRESLEEEIVCSADGNFLWVTLVTSRAVNMYRNGKPELLEEVQSIPRKITQIYESTINTLLKGNPDISLRLFQWICFAKRPLEIDDIRWAINIEPNPLYKSFKDIPGPFWGKNGHEMDKLIRTLSGGLAKVGTSKKVVFIHLSVKDYLLRAGFRILDPTLRNSRDTLTAGYNALLAACLWMITEADFAKSFDSLMESFSKSTVRMTLRATTTSSSDLSPKVGAIIGKYPLTPGEDLRLKVDAMDRSDRRLMHQYLNPDNVQDFRHGYPQNHRQMNFTGEVEEWLVIDEMVSCFFGHYIINARLQSLELIGIIEYCLQHWSDHALQLLENNSLDAVNKCLDNFFSRAHHSLFQFYNVSNSLVALAAGLPNPTVLSGILNRDIENYFPVNFTTIEEDATALMMASDKGYEDNVRVLLQQEGIQVDMKDFKGQTALLNAIGSKSRPIVELLIKHNANVDLQDKEGMTALMHSVRNDTDEITELLLRHNASTHIEDCRGLTVFDYAIDKGNLQVCRHVLKHSRQPERSDFVHRKHMAAACKNGHTNIVRLFLDNGVRTEISESQAQSRFPFSESALGTAIAADKRPVLELLLDHEFQNSGLPVWRTNLLCESVRECSTECMMSLIVHYGWEIDEVDGNGDMPIHVAIREGWANHVTLNPFCDIIKTLITLDWSPQGIIVNSLNAQLQSPLMLAIGYSGTDRFVKQILADKRVDINYQGADGTALWCSVARKRYAITECLLSYPNIDPNLGLTNGITPLQAAIIHGDLRLATLLLEHNSIRVLQEDIYLLDALRAAPHEDFWTILHDFASETAHLYSPWAIESVNDRQDTLEAIRALVKRQLPVSEQCFSKIHRRSTPEQREIDRIQSSIDLLRLLLPKDDSRQGRFQELKTGRGPTGRTLTMLLASLVFIFCTYTFMYYTM